MRFVVVLLSSRWTHSSNSEKFSSHLKSLDVSESLIRQIRQRMGDLNREIREDETNLGRGFCIGHSFFCEARDKLMSEEEWYRQIVHDRDCAAFRGVLV